MAAFAVAAGLAGCAGGPQTTASNATATPVASAAVASAVGCNAAALQQAVLQRLNEARQAGMCGDARLGPARPLVWQPALAATASRRAGEIAQRGSFGTVANPAPRLQQQGYAATAAQETQAAGDYSTEGATQALLSMPRQCTALLDPAYTDVGAACVSRPGTEFGNYWTVVVAKGTPTRSAMGANASAKASSKAVAVKKASRHTAAKPSVKAKPSVAAVKAKASTTTAKKRHHANATVK